ncbi:MAG: hypothetical protein ACR2N7_04595 [Acidimicrobiia bacterium]
MRRLNTTFRLPVAIVIAIAMVAAGCSSGTANTTTRVVEAVTTTTASTVTTATPATTTTVDQTTTAPAGDAADWEWLNDVSDVAVASDGLVYVVAPIGVASLDASGAWTLIDVNDLPEGSGLEDGWPGRLISLLAVGPDGDLWVAGHATSEAEDEQFGGVADWGGNRFLTWVARHECDPAPCSWTVFTTNDTPYLDGDIGDLAVGSDGTVFASIGDNQLLVFDGTAWESHTLSDLPTGWNGAVSPWSSSLAIGTDGMLWAGTNGGRGLYAFDGTSWTSYTIADGLPDNQTFMVTAASNGTIWVATDALYNSPSTASPEAAAGVASFDGTSWTSYTIADGLLSNDTVVVAGPDGSVWAVHYEIPPYGYARFNGTEWTSYPVDEPVGGFRTDADANGTLWTIANGEVISFDGTTKTIYSTPFTHP